MGFFQKLSRLFFPPSASKDYSYWVTVKCKRCGEQIRARVDLRNDLSTEYGADGGILSYYCRKVLVGEKLCFQQIEVELTFDSNRQLVSREIKGGEFVDEADKPH